MSWKELNQITDVTTQTSNINEIIPITGSLMSGTELYTKTYLNITSGSALSGGFFQTVFDGSPTSISSSALIDMTWGFSSASLLAGYGETFLVPEKKRVYRQMAKLLLGSEDSLFSFGGATYNEVVFLVPKRRIYKDEIKKGNTSYRLTINSANSLTLSDTGAASTYTVGPAGEEGDLFSGSTKVGKVYYNAGIIAYTTGAHVPVGGVAAHWSGSKNLDAVAISGNFDNFNTGLRNHFDQLTFHNQTNLHSTIYFCRALNSEFNYSTNPTFVDADGRVVPTSGSDNQTRTYFTKVALADINNNILAVGSLSEPVKKSPDSEIVVRVRLSY